MLFQFFSIPRGTLIIISNHDASLKESNYEDAQLYHPERWLNADSKDYHTFASLPFGHGARKCMAQNIAGTMMSMLAIRVSIFRLPLSIIAISMILLL